MWAQLALAAGDGDVVVRRASIPQFAAALRACPRMAGASMEEFFKCAESDHSVNVAAAREIPAPTVACPTRTDVFINWQLHNFTVKDLGSGMAAREVTAQTTRATPTRTRGLRQAFF